MIAGCIDKMRHDGCGGCDRQSACADMFPAFLSMLKSRRPALQSSQRRAGTSTNPFLSMLAEMAKAVEAAVGRSGAKLRPAPFGAEVERRLEPLLASGEIGIERVARDLGCSRQTLYRRLKAEGVTYEQLLDGLRRRLALRLIRDGLSVKDAAYRLGFSDPAAFSRAFKRWTGASPSDMRARR